jgi:hypothetical protein
MPEQSPYQPMRIELVWGRDRLVVDDPTWIAKISQEIAKDSQTSEPIWPDLGEPRSRKHERMEAEFVALGLHSSYEEPESRQAGYQAPNQNTVASEALKAFLGLELPVALNFTGYTGRSEHRVSAVHAAFRPCWGLRSEALVLQLGWMLSGYQLYASHHIGSPYFRPYSTENNGGHIERRLLNGQWVRWGFDGASSPPPGRRWSSNKRYFYLAPGGIQRIYESDSDLRPEYEEHEFDNDTEEGTYPSQEAK